jgi:hypothetical protein
MTLADRIQKGEAAIASAKAEGRDTAAWETKLIELKQQAGESITAPPPSRILAVLICSHVLECDIWLALDDSFNPGDGLAVFYQMSFNS